MSDLSRRYIELAHAIDAHVPGYIDGYFGPEAWAVRSTVDVARLADDVDALRADIDGLSEPDRRTFLAAQVDAMRVSVRLLAGETVSYADEVRGLYDIEPRRVPDSELDAALRRLDAALPGTGDVLSRELPLRERVAVDLDRLPRLIEVILAELRERTLGLWGLPEGESFEAQMVRDKPWGGYNWPLGNLRSRIDLNTDLPVYLTGLPDLLAHEGYPGHHTEHAWKEQRLAVEAGRLEHTVLLINAPECVVSEGIATVAREMVMSDEELRGWITGALAAEAGVDPEAAARLLEVNGAKDGLGGVSGNAALMLHEDGRPEAEVIDYLRHYGLRTEEQARKNLEFIRHPNFRSYIFTYTAGRHLLRPLLAGADRVDVFRRLLTEPVTPGVLRGLPGATA